MIDVQIGEGIEGGGAAAARVNTVLGDRRGPVGAAWVNALASPVQGHAPFVVAARPGLMVKPPTLFVNTSTLASEDHATLTWGAAQAGVAAGVLECVATGVIPPELADEAVLIAAVWVDPGATAAHQDAIFANNRVAAIEALTSGASGRPTAAEGVMDIEDGGPFFIPFYQP
jgi:5,6,7,8-tetrahydromethanopterin hydro-lyase